MFSRTLPRAFARHSSLRATPVAAQPSKFGGKYTATMIPGDGIGAEVSESVREVFKADAVPVEWELVR